MRTRTFSIVAYDPGTRELGVAVQSKFLAVGAAVPWAKAGVGAVATQSYANTTYGPEGLKLLAEGLHPQEVLEKLNAADPGRNLRQVGIVDAKGRAAAFTGAKCFPWAGHLVGKNFACQGNILASGKVVEAMAEAFAKSRGTLAERLLSALFAAQREGGDRRGQQSAALLVVKEKGVTAASTTATSTSEWTTTPPHRGAQADLRTSPALLRPAQARGTRSLHRGSAPRAPEAPHLPGILQRRGRWEALQRIR